MCIINFQKSPEKNELSGVWQRENDYRLEADS
jgi:hypothetical protein